jgi:hypothetical protein
VDGTEDRDVSIKSAGEIRRGSIIVKAMRNLTACSTQAFALDACMVGLLPAVNKSTSPGLTVSCF